MSELTYEDLQKMFNEPKYHPMKFACSACETTAFWRDLHCKECDKMLEWCAIKKERTSFIVRI
jgi:hypothetical protein